MMVHVSILPLNLGCGWPETKDKHLATQTAQTNSQYKGCKHPGFRVSICSFPSRLLYSTISSAFKAGEKQLYSLIQTN